MLTLGMYSQCCTIIYMLVVVLYKDVIPRHIIQTVKELYVPENKIDHAKSEAESLPAVDITKVISVTMETWHMGPYY